MLAVGQECSDKNDQCEVHGNSTIPGHASYLVAKALEDTGAEPANRYDRAAKLYYTVLSQFLMVRAFPGGLVAVWVGGLVSATLVALPASQLWGAAGAAVAQSLGSLVVLGGVVFLVMRKLSTPTEAHHAV